jgi:release factor glutamine methyltransferase
VAAWSVGEALAEGRRALSSRSATAGLDAQMLLAETIGAPREHLLAHPDDPLIPAQQAAFVSGLARLLAGEPLPYVLGWWEFYGRRFGVTPAVLIPRPETELLVDEALKVPRLRSDATCLIDLGTGSGCLAITLALELPGRRALASDVSREALRVARLNADLHRVRDRIDFLCLDLASGLELRQAVVLANLPYVSDEEAGSLPHEPRLALEGGADGLVLLRRLFGQLGRRRPVATTILLEIGAGQSALLQDAVAATCSPAHTWLVQDLAGHDRVLGMEF